MVIHGLLAIADADGDDHAGEIGVADLGVAIGEGEEVGASDRLPEGVDLGRRERALAPPQRGRRVGPSIITPSSPTRIQ
ncbi:MAG: hypothetical protein R3B09_11000 [Nannocystaceae bacterium]